MEQKNVTETATKVAKNVGAKLKNLSLAEKFGTVGIVIVVGAASAFTVSKAMDDGTKPPTSTVEQTKTPEGYLPPEPTDTTPVEGTEGPPMGEDYEDVGSDDQPQPEEPTKNNPFEESNSVELIRLNLTISDIEVGPAMETPAKFSIVRDDTGEELYNDSAMVNKYMQVQVVELPVENFEHGTTLTIYGQVGTETFDYVVEDGSGSTDADPMDTEANYIIDFVSWNETIVVEQR